MPEPDALCRLRETGPNGIQSSRRRLTWQNRRKKTLLNTLVHRP